MTADESSIYINKPTSGGIFTDLAKAVLRNGGAVYGAAYNDQFEVVHICVENEEGLFRLRGAKYAQSDIRGVFAEVKTRLDRGQQVLFSGTPCQVGGDKSVPVQRLRESSDG